MMSSILRGRCRISQYASEFTSKMARSRFGGGAYTFGGMVGHIALHREAYVPFTVVLPGMIGTEDCGSPVAHLWNKGTFSGSTSPAIFRAFDGPWAIMNCVMCFGCRAGEPRGRSHQSPKCYGAPTSHATIGLMLAWRATTVARRAVPGGLERVIFRHLFP